MYGTVHPQKVNLSTITDAVIVILRKTHRLSMSGNGVLLFPHNFWHIPGSKFYFKYWKTRLYAMQQFILSFNHFSSYFTLRRSPFPCMTWITVPYLHLQHFDTLYLLIG